jgi:hypothetical protein
VLGELVRGRFEDAPAFVGGQIVETWPGHVVETDGLDRSV